MTTSFITDLPLDQIEQHPKNVRHAAAADQELVDSVATHGLLQALVAVVGADGKYLLIAGHRRLDALRKAGHTTAPVLIRDDLVTEAQQIEAMLVENGRRQDLSPIEEAEGYEQLELFGYKPKDIAQATGRNVRTVRDRLKLRTLSDSTRAQIHDGQVSIHDALALAEFSDEPEKLAELEKLVGTPNFSWRLTDARRAKERQAEVDKEVAALKADGIPECENRQNHAIDGPYPIQWMHQATSRDEHTGCLAWRRTSPTFVELVCTDPSRHRKAEGSTEKAPGLSAAAEERQKEFEQRQAEVARRRDEVVAAQVVRVGHARETLSPITAVNKRLADLIRATAPLILATVDELGDVDAFQMALGYKPGPWFTDDQRASVLRDITTNVSDSTIGRVLEALLISLAEFRMHDLYDEDSAREGHAYLGWLQATGHTFCDLDNELQTQVEVLLAGDDEDQADEDGAA